MLMAVDSAAADRACDGRRLAASAVEQGSAGNCELVRKGVAELLPYTNTVRPSSSVEREQRRRTHVQRAPFPVCGSCFCGLLP